MDINELKNHTDRTIEEENKLNELRGLIEEKYLDFRNLGKKLGELISNVVKNKKENLFIEFEQFFTKNGFDINRENQNLIYAIYQDTIVKLEDEYPEDLEDEVIVSFNIKSKQIYEGIVIRSNYMDHDKLYYKNILKHDNRIIDDKNYKEVISSIKEISFLEDLHRKLDENMEWYNETIRDFNNINFIYSLYKSDKEYNSFEQLFNDL